MFSCANDFDNCVCLKCCSTVADRYPLKVRYTFGTLVATLAMIETPIATSIIRTPPPTNDEKEDPDAPLPAASSEKEPLVEQELLLVKQAPITSKFRTTIKHLRARAGPMSRFRGLRVALVYNFLHFVILELLMSLSGRSRNLEPLCFVIATTFLARMDALWTHIVISEPNSQRWYQRKVSGKQWKKLLGPTAVYAIAEQLAIHMPVALFRRFGQPSFRSIGPHHTTPTQAPGVIVAQLGLVSVVGLFSAVFILFPAAVMLRRVQASMLAEHEESIVPFDRTFGGKVVPEIVGGTGMIGMIDAWRTFDWNSRMRLMGVYFKTAAIQGAVTFLFFCVVVGELQLMVGDQLVKMIEKAQKAT